jgi:hypothetical protein
VDKLPTRRGELCAVGYSGPTFYQQDCVKNAAENARGHLAETISVSIRTVTIDISDGTRGSFSNLQGQRGANNGCYAFVCIDPSKPLEKMVEKLEEQKIPPKTIERVRENAEAAFEELEKAEEKAMEKTAPPPPPPPPPEDEKPAEEGTPETPPEGEESTDDDATPAVRKIELPTE